MVVGRTVGERVFAVKSANAKAVELYGFGVYEGDFDAPEGSFGHGIPGYKNPRIRLDDGRTVWGYQVWWGSESYFPEFRGERVVTEDKIGPCL